MRALVLVSLLALVAGCAGQRYQPPYVYSPPVVIALKSLQHTNNVSIAVFTVSDVGSEPMWYDGEGPEHPACCMEYKGMMYSGHDPGSLWGDVGLGRYELVPGQSVDFIYGRREFSGPFRMGVWLGEQEDKKTVDDEIWWSGYVTGAPDLIDNVVTNLSDGWNDDTTGTIIMPKAASTQDVLRRVFQVWLIDDSHPTNFTVLKTRQVAIPRCHFPGTQADSYTAVLVQTDHSKVVVLLRYFDIYTSRAWLSALFLAEPSL